jgi:RAMP superfamily
MDSLQVTLIYKSYDDKLFYTTDTDANKTEITHWRSFISGKNQLDPAKIAANGIAVLEGKYEENKKGKLKLKIAAIEYSGVKYIRATNTSTKTLPFHVAMAPYNFVPVNDKVIAYENDATHERYAANCHTGYITLNFETKTPVFIRGKGNKNLLVDGKPILPGSSIRGMVRNLVEITSWSQMRFVNNRRLFFRSFDSTNLQSNYIRIHEGIKAGFLYYRQHDESFFIKEAVEFPEKIDRAGKDFTISRTDKAYIVTPGFFKNRESLSPSWKFTVEYQPDSQFELSEEDVERYLSDEDRNIGDGVKLIHLAKKDSRFTISGVPVFFIVQETGILFGHTNFFRVPYNHPIGRHIPGFGAEQKDLAVSIFGIDHGQAGKVSFEDAICTENEGFFLLEQETSLKILNGPKPTTFQHYIEQPNGYETEKKNLKNWDDMHSVIRGFKQYWHRNTSDDSQDEHSWNLGMVEEGKVYPKPIIPLKRGIHFTSKIHFNNLSSIELGALLFVLDLPGEQFCHKIGLGKPLGLGSIKTKPELTITNREERYQKLFAGDGAFFKSEQDGDISSFKTNFEKFIKEALGMQTTGSKNKSIWQTDRLAELLAMLNFSHAGDDGWNEATRYLEIEHPDNKNEYRNRPVLPKPSQIIKQ